MSETAETQATYNKKVPWVAHLVVTVVILVIAVSIIGVLFSNKPEARRWGGGQSAPSVAVDIAELEISDYDVWIDSYGTADPLTRTQLVADVSGKVVSVSPSIRAGASFSKGDLLVQLDDRDFLVEVEVAASAAAEAEVRYLQEVAESQFAAKNWNERPDSEAARLLALRKPQVAAAQAALKAANARLAKAQLDLERTQIMAPFDGKVLSQTVDIGQVVTPSQPIASIYSTDIVEVRLPIKIADLDHLYIPDDKAVGTENPRVQLIGELGSTTYEWQGQIVRSEGAFDPATRMLYVVAQVESPFTATQQRPALRIGQFLRAKIQGRTLDSVFVIPRRAVSQSNKVSVADEGVLRKRQVQPLWTDISNVIVAASRVENDENSITANRLSSLLPSDKLILTPTANLPDGTKVKSLNETLTEESRGAQLIGSRAGKQAAGTGSASQSAK